MDNNFLYFINKDIENKKEILDKNSGRIDIKSKVGKGTEVVITIPTTLKTET